ncbi:AI-2E family transporter [Rheinheimera sp. UJ51]|uniref:AI-2E family transporter n=1 Tax=unclassified Rheinheimera TaxID=115860 RepID=UPI001E523181|nr:MULTISPECIES: AI-2E family transporter [unclassified Rheinheimera]MCC5451998.1 AI-2E family transporter [Rheinheimera sp. UJ51]MCF4009867.1 AI-2E family transporter [Rheinheimera sp. UJ63]
MAQIFSNEAISRVLLLLILAAGVFFFIGFLVPVLAALIICFASWPLYQKLVQRCAENVTLAATLALTIMVLGLVVPLTLVFSFALQEAKTWLQWLVHANQFGEPVPAWLAALPLAGEWLAELWQAHLSAPNQLGQFISVVTGEHLGGISRTILTMGWHTAGFLLSLLFMLITLFFLYKDGDKLALQLDTVGERILPQRWQRFSRVVPATVTSTVLGMSIIAVGEGVVLGVAYWVAGVPSPVAFGVLTGFMALVPGGAPLAFSLISLYLVGTGATTAGIGLFLWGSIELFIVDKTIRPTLVGGRIKLPFLPTFFGLIGGVKTMGLVGLFIGPVLMALLVAIWREWIRDETQKAQAEERNSLSE